MTVRRRSFPPRRAARRADAAIDRARGWAHGRTVVVGKGVRGAGTRCEEWVGC